MLSPREWSLPRGKHWTSTVRVPWHNGVMCWASDPAHEYICTRAVGHTGRHNAILNAAGIVVAVWEQS